jgi:UDPglucose 6-dehydrogenase
MGSGEASWRMASDSLDACQGADAVLILTEWDQFRELDWRAIAALMRKPAWLFDTRAIADAKAARVAGLQVWTVGEG